MALDLRIRSVLTREQIARTRRVIGELAPYARRHRAVLGGAVLCTLGGALVRIAQPWPLKVLFDDVLIPMVQAPGAQPFPMRDALIVCGATLAIGVAAGLLYYGERVLSAAAGQRIATSLRRRLFGHLLTLSYERHRRLRRGDLVNLLGRDIQHLKELLVDLIAALSSTVLQVTAMLVVMFVLNVKLTLVCIAILPLLAISSARISTHMRRATHKQRKEEGELMSSAQEVLEAIAVVKLFGREVFERRRFSRTNRKSLRAGLRMKRLEAGLNRRVELLLAAGACAFVFVAIHEVWRGASTAGELLVFAAYMKGFQKPLRKLSRTVLAAARATVCGERVLSVLAEPGEVVDVEIDSGAGPRAAGDVRFEGVTFRYGEGEPVLRDVTFSVPAGSLVAVVGPSGGGKSSLLALISGLVDPSEGRIFLDGRDVSQAPLAWRRAHVTGVLQDAHLFWGRVSDNLRYGREEAGDEQLWEALRRAEAGGFVERLPERLDGTIGDRGLTLSGGEQRRLAIARALLRDAPIVVLDEPTAGLDDDSAAAVIAALGELARGRTTFWVTHDHAQVAGADMTLTVAGGRVVAIDARSDGHADGDAPVDGEISARSGLPSGAGR